MKFRDFNIMIYK